MSHFTKCDLKITNLVALKRALDELGHKYNEAKGEVGVEVRGYKGQKLTGELSIDMGKYDIGVVKQEDGTYALEADWWGIETTSGKTEAEVMKEVNAQYAYQRVVAAVEEAGYSIDAKAVAEDGTVKLNVSKWE